jgi:hypothetical protein
LTPFVVLTTLSNGIQRKRIASVSDPAFLLDDGERCSLEMPDLRTPADFYSLVQSQKSPGLVHAFRWVP